MLELWVVVVVVVVEMGFQTDAGAEIEAADVEKVAAEIEGCVADSSWGSIDFVVAVVAAVIDFVAGLERRFRTEVGSSDTAVKCS